MAVKISPVTQGLSPAGKAVNSQKFRQRWLDMVDKIGAPRCVQVAWLQENNRNQEMEREMVAGNQGLPNNGGSRRKTGINPICNNRDGSSVKISRKQRSCRQQKPSAVAGALLLALPDPMLHVGESKASPGRLGRSWKGWTKSCARVRVCREEGTTGG
ncbi:hypothetical protein LXL04_006836 [Taraxacum kok-saghyz]